MGYLNELYGKRDPEFIKGFLAALDLCSYYHNNKKVVFDGRIRNSLFLTMRAAVNELAEIPEDFEWDISRYIE